MPDPVYVLVRDKSTKHVYPVVESAVDPEGHEVLDKPGMNPDGSPVETKHHKVLSSRSSTSGQKADTKKEG